MEKTLRLLFPEGVIMTPPTYRVSLPKMWFKPIFEFFTLEGVFLGVKIILRTLGTKRLTTHPPTLILTNYFKFLAGRAPTQPTEILTKKQQRKQHFINFYAWNLT